jgi:single-stranded-DNA-specific exonuclease
MSDLLSSLLTYYHLDQEGYSALCRAPSFSSIPLIDQDPNVQKAVARILHAILEKQRILVYGDYDCDGVMSTSIMVKCLRDLGARVASYLPSRYLDGYGLTLENAKKLPGAGYSLVITVDNGVAAFEPIAFLESQKIDVIVIDHHEIQKDLPNAYAIIHPTTLKYGDVPVSAGYLSFLMSVALLKKKDDYLLSLGALSTLSDMMPLRSYNREIVRLGLEAMNANHYPALSAYLEKFPLDEKILSLDFIPAVNAIGRMVEDTTINRLVPYFTEEDAVKRGALSLWMKDVNARRKALTKEAELSVSIDPNEPAILVVSSLPEGLNGLLANRLLNEYSKPVCVFSPCKSDPSLLVGSMRSQEGFNVMKALEGLDHYVVKGGGHAFAGGLSIKKEDLPAFQKELYFDALKFQINPPKKERIPLSLEDCTLENYNLVRIFGPFGMEWKEPEFLLKDVATASLLFTKDGKYLSSPLKNGARLFSFSLGAKDLESLKQIDLAAKLSLNSYKGRTSLDVIVEKA